MVQKQKISFTESRGKIYFHQAAYFNNRFFWRNSLLEKLSRCDISGLGKSHLETDLIIGSIFVPDFNSACDDSTYVPGIAASMPLTYYSEAF